MILALILYASLSIIDPNETKAMLEFYASYTGEKYYNVIEKNWGQNVVCEYIHCEHNAYQIGDLNRDGVVGQEDMEIYNSLQNPAGWTLGGKTHWYRDCSYIAGKAVRAVEINNNLCIRCKARLANGN